MKGKKRIATAFRIAVSLTLIVWLVRMVDTTQLTTKLAGANLFYVALMMIGTNIDRILMAFKWNLLLRAKGIRLPLVDATSSYYKSSFWGSLFLPTVGADSLRVFEISARTQRASDIISSVVLERVGGILAVALVGMISLGLFITHVDDRWWHLLMTILGLFVILLVLLCISLTGEWWKALYGWLDSSKWKVIKGLGKVLRSYQDYAQHGKTLALFLGLSVIEQFIPVVTTFLIARAIDIAIPFITFVIFVPLVVMIVRLPISTDGIGVREGLFVYLFGLVGVSQEDAFLVGLLSSVLWRVAVAPLTLYFFLARRPQPQPPKAGVPAETV